MRRLTTIILATALTLTACNRADDTAVSRGGATPAASPAATDPDGTVVKIGEVTDLVTAGDKIAARVGDTLYVGTSSQFQANKADTHDIATCDDVTATEGTIAVACGNTVRLFGDRNEEIAVEDPTSTAVITTSGELITASHENDKVSVYVDGHKTKTFDVAAPTDQLLDLPRDGHPDSVLRINRGDTTIQDVRWTESRQGGTLRVGLGVGMMSPGTNGLAIVSDTTGNQIAIYTAYDVVRLQQTSPTGQSPWAVAWDGELAWAASTAENVAYGYSISGGVPVETRKVNTIADVRGMVATQGGLVFGGKDGLQFTSPTPKEK